MYRDHDCLHLTYEELCESQSDKFNKILSFLEVPHASLSTTMVKVLKKNTDLVTNLSEVYDALTHENEAITDWQWQINSILVRCD